MPVKSLFQISIYTLLCLSCTQPASQQAPAATQGVAPAEVQAPSDTLDSTTVARGSDSDGIRSVPRGVPVPEKDFKKMKKDAEKLGPAEKGDADRDEDQ